MAGKRGKKPVQFTVRQMHKLAEAMNTKTRKKDIYNEFIRLNNGISVSYPIIQRHMDQLMTDTSEVFTLSNSTPSQISELALDYISPIAQNQLKEYTSLMQVLVDNDGKMKETAQMVYSGEHPLKASKNLRDAYDVILSDVTAEGLTFSDTTKKGKAITILQYLETGNLPKVETIEFIKPTQENIQDKVYREYLLAYLIHEHGGHTQALKPYNDITGKNIKISSMRQYTSNLRSKLLADGFKLSDDRKESWHQIATNSLEKYKKHQVAITQKEHPQDYKVVTKLVFEHKGKGAAAKDFSKYKNKVVDAGYVGRFYNGALDYAKKNGLTIPHRASNAQERELLFRFFNPKVKAKKIEEIVQSNFFDKWSDRKKVARIEDQYKQAKENLSNKVKDYMSSQQEVVYAILASNIKPIDLAGEEKSFRDLSKRIIDQKVNPEEVNKIEILYLEGDKDKDYLITPFSPKSKYGTIFNINRQMVKALDKLSDNNVRISTFGTGTKLTFAKPNKQQRNTLETKLNIANKAHLGSMEFKINYDSASLYE